MQLDRFALVVLLGGRPAREYGHDGRTYIPGRPGKEYTARLVSRSHRRAKAVVSVDGLNVIDGKPAGLCGSGYILDAYSALDIPGWRLTDEEVARFVFGAPEASYAAASGKAENVGVIAAAFFDEVVRPVPTVALTNTVAKGPGVTREAAPRHAGVPGTLGGSLGTGFGGKADHAVKRVEFEAQTRPATVIEVRYEDAAILRAMGVDVDDDADLLHTPTAFPAEGYCAPPRNWRG